METVVTRNGQITIGKRIREELGITEGTRLDLEVDGEAIRITKKGHDWHNRESIYDDELVSKLEKFREEADKKTWERLHERLS